MKAILTLFITLLAGIGTISHAAENWKLAWSDEFDYTGLPDAKRWTFETGFIRNNEAQYYTAGRKENARVEGGHLIIEARRESFHNAGFHPGAKGQRGRQQADYTSASLTTEHRFAWKYGRIEVRARLPRGRGAWPAIWMLGTNQASAGWPNCGEIDIMEYVGFEPDVIHANIHAGKYNHARGTGKGSSIRIEKPFDAFHLYAMEWRPDRLDFFVDGRIYFTYKKEPEAGNDAWPFDKPFYLILNLAIGGTWGAQKGIDEAIFPQRYEVDYVRVYSPAGRLVPCDAIPARDRIESYLETRRLDRAMN
jgi:beta-glucanase (GH16 family)